jgi:hypothetical protein
MANQFTKAESAGEEKPKGANQFTTGKRKALDEATRDKIRAERAAQVAEKIMNDPESSRDQKLAAAKVLMPYGKSTLQSIESRQYEEPVSEQETLAKLTHLFSSNPGLLKPLIDADPGLRAAIKSMIEGQPAVVDAQQTPKQAA